MFNQILVPLDGSQLAERAIPHSKLIAKIFNSKVTLLTVQDSSQGQSESLNIDPLSWQIKKTETELYLQSIAARFREDNIDVSYQILEGNASENIVNFAQAENIDLLVISSHGWSGLSRWETSSVTQKVLEKAYIPVLLVRSFQTTAMDAGIYYKRILLPVDGSQRAECALSVAVSFAQETQSLILLANVIQKPKLPFLSDASGELQQLTDRFVKVYRTTVEQYLQSLQQRLPVESQTRLTESSSVPLAIHELTGRENIDLVILCAHGHTGLAGWPYGSVARNIIEHGQVTTLIFQDIPRAQVKPTPVEIAAENYGRR
jgi:nucleotide-binding universal stress UspA family protein